VQLHIKVNFFNMQCEVYYVCIQPKTGQKKDEPNIVLFLDGFEP